MAEGDRGTPPAWADARRWAGLRDGSLCPICRAGAPADLLLELPSLWVTAPHEAALPYSLSLFSKRHAVEPFELPSDQRAAFWEDVNRVGAVIADRFQPTKLNYEIHGNTIPHLHVNLFPRWIGDRFEGGPIDARQTSARPEAERAALRAALTPLRSDGPSSIPAADPYAAQKNLAWREVAEIDGRLERGEIDEAGWHAAIAGVIVPAYLAATTPWEGSGKAGSREDWEYARSHIAHAIDRDGSFLDIGCANGYLLECLPRWTVHRLDRYGLDIAPELVALAAERLPDLADRLFVGNALEWSSGRSFTYIRTGLEYVPRHRRRDVVDRLAGFCDRLIIGVFGEEADARPTEDLLQSWGYAIAGRSDRVHRRKAGFEYRVLWIDAADGSQPAT
jgi:diadenosine tetraphosphate (Ap4A) HIT family hydrolase/SAM-dependent methyltransferase